MVFKIVPSPQARLAEKLDAVNHAVAVLPFDAQLAAFLGAGGKENGLETLAERLEGDVLTDAAVIDERDALAADQFDLVVQLLAAHGPGDGRAGPSPETAFRRCERSP